MFKFLNCFLNSFFRTLGRIIVYILLGLVFSTILSKIDVHADMATPQEITFDNTTYSTYYEIPVFYQSRDLRIRINDRLRNFSTIGTENTNLILDICSSAPLNIWRTYAAGSACSTSCFSQLVQIKQIPNLTCRTYTYNDNKAYRIVLPINLWNMSGVTSPELDNISFDDKITLSNNTPHDVYASIYGAYYSSIGFDINNQDALFNDLNQTQQNILNKQNEIINSQNNNTDKVIDNQNSNTDKTIENQNENTDKQIDSQKVCTDIVPDKNNIVTDGYYLDISGNSKPLGYSGITDYIPINSESKVDVVISRSSIYSCFYTSTKDVISCFDTSNVGNVSVPSNASYLRISIDKNLNKPSILIRTCQNGNQAISGGLNDINGSLNNSDTTEATNDANNFFNNFTTDLHGLTGIITAPLNSINSLTNKTCSPLVLPLPFVNKDLTLPCMRSIYDEHFGDFMTLYDTITFGIVSYWVCVRIFSFVKDFKNPEHDEIEVVDL